jgi:dihydrofolate synthase/folylpolyglutamate synthase
MTYDQTVAYLFSQLPNYQNQGQGAYKANLNNITSFSNYLENPQSGFKSIHIAGTNGKGSTAHILASVLQNSGFKVGVFTSPHLLDFRERIKINSEYIPQDDIVAFVDLHQSFCETIDLSFFEWCTGLAFDYFNKEQVDFAIIETGLGGRLDSTNILNPELSIITTIGLDHTNILGDSLELIAKEKAGIIKANTDVILGNIDPSLHPIFKDFSDQLNSTVHIADQSTDYRSLSDLKPNYQRTNLNTAYAAIEFLKSKGFEVDFEKGIKNVSDDSGMIGRWQKIGHSPTIILDCAHNAEGIAACMDELLSLDQKLHIVFGTVQDKDHDDILSLLPSGADYYFTAPSNQRGLDSTTLQSKAAKHGLIGASFSSVEQALDAAKQQSSKDDIIFIGGSTFVVADLLISSKKQLPV